MRNKIQEAKRRASQRADRFQMCLPSAVRLHFFFFPAWKVLTPRAPYRNLIPFTFVNRRKKERRKKGVKKGNEEEEGRKGRKRKNTLKGE